MANSPILDIPLVSANQSNKETTINDAIAFLEKAISANTVLTMTADVTLTKLDIQRFYMFTIAGATADRTITVPSMQKIFAIDNTNNTYAINVVRGAVTRTVAAGTVAVLFIDNARLLYVNYSATGGSQPFNMLSDVPPSYAGQAGKFLRVKADELGIEFAATGAGVSKFTDLSDTPANYTGHNNKLVKVNAAGTGLEFSTGTSITMEDLSDVPAYAGKGGYFPRIKEDESGIEWVLTGESLTQFLELQDTPFTYTGQAGKVLMVAPDESGLMFGAGGGGGASSYFDLTEVVDNDFTGKALYYVRVNPAGDGLELAPAGGDLIDSILDLGDVPDSFSGHGGQVLRVNDAETGVEFFGISTAVKIALFAQDTLDAGETLLRYLVTDPIDLTSFTTSRANAAVAAAASTVLTILKNGSPIGTVTFNAAGTNGNFAGAGATFTAGDVLSIVAPATADTTLADVAITLHAQAA